MPVGEDFELFEFDGGSIDFAQLAEPGVRSFIVYGLGPASAQAPVFGLRFLEPGDASVQTLSVSAVPEPVGGWMLLCGLGAVGWALHRRRTGR